jgi:hypothetical protein
MHDENKKTIVFTNLYDVNKIVFEKCFIDQKCFFKIDENYSVFFIDLFYNESLLTFKEKVQKLKFLTPQYEAKQYQLNGDIEKFKKSYSKKIKENKLKIKDFFDNIYDNGEKDIYFLCTNRNSDYSFCFRKNIYSLFKKSKYKNMFNLIYRDGRPLTICNEKSNAANFAINNPTWGANIMPTSFANGMVTTTSAGYYAVGYGAYTVQNQGGNF